MRPCLGKPNLLYQNCKNEIDTYFPDILRVIMTFDSM